MERWLIGWLTEIGIKANAHTGKMLKTNKQAKPSSVAFAIDQNPLQCRNFTIGRFYLNKSFVCPYSFFCIGRNNAQYICHFVSFAAFSCYCFVALTLFHPTLASPCRMCLCFCVCLCVLRWSQYINRQIEFDVLQLYMQYNVPHIYYYFICLYILVYLHWKIASLLFNGIHWHWRSGRRHFLIHKNRIIPKNIWLCRKL